MKKIFFSILPGAVRTYLVPHRLNVAIWESWISPTYFCSSPMAAYDFGKQILNSTLLPITKEHKCSVWVADFSATEDLFSAEVLHAIATKMFDLLKTNGINDFIAILPPKICVLSNQIRRFGAFALAAGIKIHIVANEREAETVINGL